MLLREWALAGEALVRNENGGTQGMVGGGGEVEVDGVEDCEFEIDNQAASTKSKSKKQAFQAAFLAAFLVSAVNSDSSLIYHFESWSFQFLQYINAIIPTRIDTMLSLNGAPDGLPLGLHNSLWDRQLWLRP